MNKRYYWLKLKDDFFNSDDIKIILKKENGSEYVIFWQKLLLKAITSKEIGILRYKENIPYNPEILSTITDTNIDIVKGALSLFLKLGMIDIADNGDIIIDEFIQELIGTETDVAKRVRKHRKKKLLHSNKTKQISNTEKEKESEIKKNKKKESNIIPPLLEKVQKYFSDNNSTENEGLKFHIFYESKGWYVGRNKMKNWHSAARGWILRNKPEKDQGQHLDNKKHFEQNKSKFKKRGLI